MLYRRFLKNGADDEARTRYLHLGKVALYQMSYIRISVLFPTDSFYYIAPILKSQHLFAIFLFFLFFSGFPYFPTGLPVCNGDKI